MDCCDDYDSTDTSSTDTEAAEYLVAADPSVTTFPATYTDPTTSWASMGSLGSTGALLDQTQQLVNDIQADQIQALANPVVEVPTVYDGGYGGYGGYDAYGAGALPVSGDTAALMEQINGQMAVAQEIYEGGLADAANAPMISPAVQDQLDLIQNTLNATPEQLNYMNGMLGGDIARQSVSNDVAAWEQDLSNSNAAHEAIQSSDDAITDADGVLNSDW